MTSSGRAERESRARYTIHRALPDLLRNSPRARHGLSQADLVADPPSVIKTPTTAATPVIRPDLKIRITTGDVLQAAARCADRPYASKRGAESRQADEASLNVTVHNMASLKTPGGGFLNGGNGQEEFLCARTTLHGSLFDDFYPLPEIGGVYTPDVLVFRDTNAIDLARRDRFFINVITAGIPKHSDGRNRNSDIDAECSCGVSYCDRDRDVVLRKMKAVLRIAQSKGSKRLVLGAWGCGSLNHPILEVARLWRRVLVGSPRQRRPNAEQWEGIDEIIFSIPHRDFAREFRRVFDDVLAPDSPIESEAPSPKIISAEDVEVQRSIARAASLELQIEQAGSAYVRGQLKEELRAVNHELALGRSKASQRDYEDEDEDLEDDYVVSGFAGSDGEDNSFYTVGGDYGTTTGSDSDSSDGGRPRSENYEFRFGEPMSSSAEDEDEEDSVLVERTAWVGVAPSPHFDPSTGWFKGSIDELSAHVFSGKRKGEEDSSISPRSPLIRPDSNSANDGGAVDGFLSRFRRAEVDDQS